MVRVTKDPKFEAVDEPTYAGLVVSDFKNGSIEVSVLSKLLADALDHARGFIGLWVDIGTDGYFTDLQIKND